MSWIARKLSMSDDVDQKQVIQEYLQAKQEEEVKKFWEEYEDEYFTGGDNNG